MTVEEQRNAKAARLILERNRLHLECAARLKDAGLVEASERVRGLGLNPEPAEAPHAFLEALMSDVATRGEIMALVVGGDIIDRCHQVARAKNGGVPIEGCFMAMTAAAAYFEAILKTMTTDDGTPITNTHIEERRARAREMATVAQQRSEIAQPGGVLMDD